MWLIASTCYTIVLLSGNVDATYRDEKYKIYFMLLIYVTSYSVTFAYHCYLLYKHISQDDENFNQ